MDGTGRAGLFASLRRLSGDLVELAVSIGADSPERLAAAAMHGTSAAETVKGLAGKFGENIQIRRVVRVEGDRQLVRAPRPRDVDLRAARLCGVDPRGIGEDGLPVREDADASVVTEVQRPLPPGGNPEPLRQVDDAVLIAEAVVNVDEPLRDPGANRLPAGRGSTETDMGRRAHVRCLAGAD